MIRSLDVCEKKWTKVGDMGLSTFALQSCASERLQVAFTCGGEAPLHNSNSDMCIVSRLEDTHIELSETYEECDNLERDLAESRSALGTSQRQLKDVTHVLMKTQEALHEQQAKANKSMFGEWFC